MISSQTNLFVPNASPRTHVRVSGEQLAKSLQQTELTEQNSDDLVVISAQTGAFHLEDKVEDVRLKEGESVLPLRFGPLQSAMSTIENKQEWLLSHEPVIKTERNGDSRIDFINYGGFVFGSDGGYVSHTVNPW